MGHPMLLLHLCEYADGREKRQIVEHAPICKTDVAAARTRVDVAFPKGRKDDGEGARRKAGANKIIWRTGVRVLVSEDCQHLGPEVGGSGEECGAALLRPVDPQVWLTRFVLCTEERARLLREERRTHQCFPHPEPRERFAAEL